MLLILKELGLSASYLRGVGLFFFGLTPVERGELGQEDNPLVEVVLHTKEIFHLSASTLAAPPGLQPVRPSGFCPPGPASAPLPRQFLHLCLQLLALPED